MARFALALAIVFFWPSAAFAQASGAIGSVEARWPQVYCDLLEVSRPAPHELMVRYRYRNTGKQALILPNLRNLVRDTAVLDAEGNKLYHPLKDAAGKLIGSTTLDEVNSGKKLLPGSSQTHWVKVEAPPEGTRSATVIIAGAHPFESVPLLARGPDSALLIAPRTARAAQEMEAGGMLLEVVDVRRTAGGTLNVLFRYVNRGPAVHSFPNLTDQVRRAYLLDSGGRKKYEVVRDTERQSLCSSTLGLGETLGAKLSAGSSLNMWAKFAAPPEAVQKIALYLPDAPPFEALEIEGAGDGAAGAGQNVGGAVTSLEAILKRLEAKVVGREIRIALDADILFDFDKATVKKEAEPALLGVADVIRAHPGSQIFVEGHTDSKGAAVYNQQLSERRAASVSAWLAAREGLGTARLTTRGFGATRPAAQNRTSEGADDPEGRRRNRRVEIVVLKPAAD